MLGNLRHSHPSYPFPPYDELSHELQLIVKYGGTDYPCVLTLIVLCTLINHNRVNYKRVIFSAVFFCFVSFIDFIHSSYISHETHFAYLSVHMLWTNEAFKSAEKIWQIICCIFLSWLLLTCLLALTKKSSLSRRDSPA